MNKMKSNYTSRKLYYLMKPFLPRALQIALRRRVVARRLPAVRNVWPINPQSGRSPDGWKGWPGGTKFALVLTHDVENTRGVSRCLRLAAAEQRLGFLSSFNFVPEKYSLDPRIRRDLTSLGFEVGVHDLRHDGRLYQSKKIFSERAQIINSYLKMWGSVGFRSGSMHHNLEWIQGLDVEYDTSTFDTDPFEPQPDGIGSIFPLWISGRTPGEGYVELPYTLPQDITVFILLQQESPRIWKEKVAWISEKGGMALLNTHPDYMSWEGERSRVDEYPHERYLEFVRDIAAEYRGRYWHALPRDVARYWKACSGVLQQSKEEGG